jgi:60 kDa SS-A/Ro ribonucleoprotein
LKVYKSGHGVKGSLTWTPLAEINQALDEAFYASFINAPVTNKDYFIGVDCSGSMGMGRVAGLELVTPIEAAVALAMVILHSEKNVEIRGYSGGSLRLGSKSSSMIDLGITRRMHIDTAVKKALDINWGSTDCSMPYKFALENKLKSEVFLNITDNETNSNSEPPSVVLQRYREKTGIAAKQLVCAMSGGNFSIADPNDAGSMDLVGFDAGCPALIANFVTDGKVVLTDADGNEE